MIVVTLHYPAEYNVTNNAQALATANLHGWRIRENEVRSAENPGSKVYQVLTLVPVHGGLVDHCPADLMIALMTVAKDQWGGIFALETRVGGS